MSKKNTKEEYLYIFLHIPKTGGTTFIQHLKNNSKSEEWVSLKNIKNLSQDKKRKIKYISGHETYYGIHKYFPNKIPRYIIFLRNTANRRISQYNHDISRMTSNKKPIFKKWYKTQIKDELCFLLNKKFKGIPGRKIPITSPRIVKYLRIGTSKIIKMIGFKIFKALHLKRNKKQELENAKYLLNKCWFIGITEHLDKDLKELSKKMKLKGKIKRYRTAKDKNEDQKTLEIKKSFNPSDEIKEKINKDNPYDLNLYNYADSLKS